jgi:hypothetical protein
MSAICMHGILEMRSHDTKATHQTVNDAILAIVRATNILFLDLLRLLYQILLQRNDVYNPVRVAYIRGRRTWHGQWNRAIFTFTAVKHEAMKVEQVHR